MVIFEFCNETMSCEVNLVCLIFFGWCLTFVCTLFNFPVVEQVEVKYVLKKADDLDDAWFMDFKKVFEKLSVTEPNGDEVYTS